MLIVVTEKNSTLQEQGVTNNSRAIYLYEEK